jgi:hypothetical protein
MGNLQVRFLEGWALAMAPGHSTNDFSRCHISETGYRELGTTYKIEPQI